VAYDNRRMVALHAAGIELNDNMFRIVQHDQTLTTELDRRRFPNQPTYGSALQERMQNQNRNKYRRMQERGHPGFSPTDININIRPDRRWGLPWFPYVNLGLLQNFQNAFPEHLGYTVNFIEPPIPVADFLISPFFKDTYK